MINLNITTKALCISIFLYCQVPGEEINRDQLTLFEPLNDNAISLENIGDKGLIELKAYLINQSKEVLFGFSVTNLDTGVTEQSILRNALKNQTVEVLDARKEIAFPISVAEILRVVENSATVSTTFPEQNIFEGGKYPMRLNVPYKFCVTLDSNGKPLAVYSIICVERLNGPVYMRYLKNGKLAPSKEIE